MVRFVESLGCENDISGEKDISDDGVLVEVESV